MAKHRRKWNEDIYNKLVSKGRGQGEGKDYKPWILIQDFASKGTVARIYSHKTKRIHHLLSNNERYYFYLLEWSEQVLDIREQFPLADVQLAIEAAAGAGIRYPVDYVSNFPYVLTCDFMITTRRGLKARTVKLASELNNPRVVEKLEIERRYWKKLDVDWKLVTENEIDYDKARNLEWLRMIANHFNGAFEERFMGCFETFQKLFEKSEHSVISIGNLVDHDYGLPDGTGLLIFKHLVYTRRIAFDIGQKLRLNEPRKSTIFAERIEDGNC